MTPNSTVFFLTLQFVLGKSICILTVMCAIKEPWVMLHMNTEGFLSFSIFFFRGYGAEACTARLTLLPPSVPLFHVLVGDEVVWRQCRYGWCYDAVSHRFVPGLKLFEGKDLSSATAPWNNSIPSIYRWRWVSYVTWGVFTNEVFFLNPRVKSNNNHTPCHLCLMACCCILHLCHVFPWSSEIAVAQTNGALTLKSLLIQSP